MTKKVKEKKVDIFELFRKMNNEDYEWVMSMSEEDLKTVSVYVLLMWIHGVDRNQSTHLILTNSYVNQYVFHLGHHSRLLLLLMFVTNGGMGSPRYQFKKSVSKQETKSVKAVAEFYKCTYDDAKGYLEILSPDEVKEMIEIYDQTIGSK